VLDDAPSFMLLLLTDPIYIERESLVHVCECRSPLFAMYAMIMTVIFSHCNVLINVMPHYHTTPWAVDGNYVGG